MTDPKRWLTDPSQTDSLEARVLAAGTTLEPPVGLVEQSLASFAALVAPGGVVSAPLPSAGSVAHAAAGEGAALSSGTTATSAILSAGVLKALGLGALLGTLTMTSAHFLAREPSASPKLAAPPATRAAIRLENPQTGLPSSEREPASPDSVVAPRVSEASEPALAERQPPKPKTANSAREFSSERSAFGAPGDAPTNAAASRAAFPDEAPPAHATAASVVSPTARKNLLEAEALELAEAKNSLERGRASEALSLLIAGSQRFARGVLSDERELLTVQALSSIGQREEARRRAHAFLSSHGAGSIALRMQRLLERL